MEFASAFLLDFDGTVSKRDIGFSILNEFSTGDWKEIDDDFLKGKIGSPEAYRKILKKIRADEISLKSYVLKVEELDPHFKKFYEMAKRKNTAVCILSDGFGFYIRETFKKHGLNSIPVYANEVEFKGNSLELKTPFGVQWCEMCGTCKLNVLREWKKRAGRLIYIGDGYSDRCAVEEADDVFSKRTLWNICLEKGIDSWFFRDFSDILNVLNWKKKLIIFDLDGTLVDSIKGVEKAYEHLAGEKGIDPERFRDRKIILGSPLREILRKVLPEEEVEESIRIFRNYYSKIYLEETKLLPHAQECIEWLYDRGYTLAVLTNKSGRFARNLLEHFGLLKFFKTVIGDGDTEHFKPSKEAVRFIIEKCGANSSEAVLVGDSIYDGLTARMGEIDFIGVSTGFFSRKELAEVKPLRICGNLKGLMEGLKTIHTFQEK